MVRNISYFRKKVKMSQNYRVSGKIGEENLMETKAFGNGPELERNTKRNQMDL